MSVDLHHNSQCDIMKMTILYVHFSSNLRRPIFWATRFSLQSRCGTVDKQRLNYADITSEVEPQKSCKYSYNRYLTFP